MKNTIIRLTLVITLLFLCIETNAQITVRIDSLVYSREISDAYYADDWGPGLHVYFTLENHSGHDIIALTDGEPKGSIYVSLYLELFYELGGFKYNSVSPCIEEFSQTVTVNEEFYDYKGVIARYALVLHDGDSISGWDCDFEPFYKSPFSNLPLLENPESRIVEWNRLQRLLVQVIPTISIAAHPTERVWEW